MKGKINLNCVNSSGTEEYRLLGCGFVRTGVSEERIAFIIRVERINGLETLIITSN
jgi:hypothetical protein